MGHQVLPDLDHEVSVRDDGGHSCARVGAVDEKTIMEYIENQKWDEDDQGFKITAPTEP